MLFLETTDSRKVALQIRHIVSVEELIPPIGETSITTVNGEVYITTLAFDIVVAAMKAAVERG